MDLRQGNGSLLCLFHTGSNSYLLSGEIMTKLTGRYIEFEMFPLSFEEYEDIKKYYGKEIAPDRQEELPSFLLTLVRNNRSLVPFEQLTDCFSQGIGFG